MLFRLICFLNSTSHYRLTGKIGDPPDKLRLLLFVDADLAGDPGDTKSRSGGYLFLAGPNTWFPITWISRKQTATSRSTTEAEIVALAICLFTEALPTLGLFCFSAAKWTSTSWRIIRPPSRSFDLGSVPNFVMLAGLTRLILGPLAKCWRTQTCTWNTVILRSKLQISSPRLYLRQNGLELWSCWG